MRAVYDSILYRASKRGLSICNTISQPYQYSFLNSGMKMKYNEKMLTVLSIVRKMNTVVRGADFYHAASMETKPAWAYKFKLVAVVNGHLFYRS